MTNAPAADGEAPREALARRLVETADKEVWNGATLVGPHRDDLAFELDGRDLAGFASRGQQRTAILAFKLAELDLLTVLDGRPPLLLLDDVFSELDPERRAHLVRRIAALPQAFVTTTTLGRPRSGAPRDRRDLGGRPIRGRGEAGGPAGRGRTGSAWTRRGPAGPDAVNDERRRRGPMSRIGDLIPDAAARLGLADELRHARAVATFDAIVAERAPAAHGACRVVRVEGAVLVVEADAPIVAQELRLHARQLRDAFRTAPSGAPVSELRVTVRGQGCVFGGLIPAALVR